MSANGKGLVRTHTISKMESFTTIVYEFYPLDNVAKLFMLEVYRGPSRASECVTFDLLINSFLTKVPII